MPGRYGIHSSQGECGNIPIIRFTLKTGKYFVSKIWVQSDSSCVMAVTFKKVQRVTTHGLYYDTVNLALC